MALALLLVLITVDITALHLRRQELHALADAVALDAADALDENAFYETGAGELPVLLSDESVRAAARDYLQRNPDAVRNLEVDLAGPTGALQGTTAEVTLTGRAQIPLVGLVVRRWSGGVPLHATSRATAREAGP
ncbi:hypothetical protein KIH74_34495 [Kineosporia sp. J2-2]|uniref:Flp pilus-assembly TadG-like N-terminal domain-containing protein n=1 Tax=Kineosporia corallincola TaxID=2835133 RepID=A0ABS5TTG0_9ACTN|nr:hypothetical protein [Kineosporia corallincola]